MTGVDGRKGLARLVLRALYHILLDSDVGNLVRVPRISIHDSFNQVDNRKV